MMRKQQNSNLRSNYTITFQISLILCLAFMLALTNIQIQPSTITTEIFFDPQTEPIIDLPPIIEPITPPPPLKPLIPTTVPDDFFIDDEIIIPNLEFDTFEYQPPVSPKKSQKKDIFDIHGVEVLPSMIGGLEALYSKVKYPELARKSGITGTVVVEFIVNKKGEVVSPKIIRGIGGGCDEEVLKVIQSMRFSPGVQNGTIVKVRMAQSVKFRLTK